MKKLIVATMLIISGNIFADVYSDYEQRKYNQDMLAQQKEQNRLLQQQATQQQQTLSEQQLYNDNQQRQQSFGMNNFAQKKWSTY